MMLYHVLDNTSALCALGDACAIEAHYLTEGEARAAAGLPALNRELVAA